MRTTGGMNSSVTVLMSCYNAERWLDEAVNSVLAQTHDDFEFIIIDDGSTDGTSSILKRMTVGDQRIVVISKPNTGLTDSLNVGIEAAQGEWIARIDADDVWEPTRLEKQLKLIHACPDTVFVGTELTLIDEDGMKIRNKHYPSGHAALVRYLTTARKFPPHSSAFYPAQLVKSMGGYRTRFKESQDRDLWLRLSERGKLVCLREPLVRVRRHAEQATNEDFGRRQMQDARVAMVSYWIRQYGGKDPVAADFSRFSEFRLWVQGQLQEIGCIETDVSRAVLKQRIISNKRKPHVVIGLCAKNVMLILSQFRFYVMGDQISQRLARKWLKRIDKQRRSETETQHSVVGSN